MMHNNNAHLKLNSFAESFFILKTEATQRKQQDNHFTDITKIKRLGANITKTKSVLFDSNKQERIMK
jgi:Trp operon repressor